MENQAVWEAACLATEYVLIEPSDHFEMPPVPQNISCVSTQIQQSSPG